MTNVLIGIGNPDRRDDGVGLHVVRQLRDALEGLATVQECRGEATELMERWSGAGKVVIVDALQCARPGGTVVRLDAAARPLSVDLRQSSTHGFGLAEAIELGRSLGTLPAEVIVYGIQGADFSPGRGMSAEVREAAERCSRRVLAEF